MWNLFLHELRARWRGILLWGIGLGLFGSMYVGLYPEFADAMPALSGLSIYRIMGIEMATFEGYIASVVVNILPVLLLVFVVTASTDTLGGEEDRGTLELLVTMPLERWQILTVKALVIALAALVMLLITSAISGLTLAWVRTQVEVAATPLQLTVALMGGWFLLLAVMAIGLFVSMVVPDRRTAVAIMATFVIASYFGENIAAMIETISSVQYLSLFAYVDTSADVFSEGIQIGNVAVLLTVAAIAFAAALWAFQRRNLMIGAWLWQRGQPPAEAATS